MAKKNEGMDIKDVANKMWMAGIGVLRSAEEEGSRLFKSLVDKGAEFQESSREVTQKQLDKVGSVLKGGVGNVRGKVENISSVRDGFFDKIGIDDILAGLLKRFGMPTKKEVDFLTRKIDQLSATIKELKATLK